MWTFTIRLIIFFVCIQVIQSADEKENEFIPTHEWQIIKKGQKIPKGLHVRVNLATGKTEAKLLDEKGKPNKPNALVEIPTDHKTENLDTDVIKEALKKIKNDDNLKYDKNVERNKDFRSYEQIKEDLSDSNLTAKVDSEIMRELFEQYKREMGKNVFSEHAISRILEDFDFLAHQFDNGLEFVRQNGFNKIIYRNLNLTTEKIKTDTLRLFGSLVQNNAKVQIHALETGSIPILLRILNLEFSTEVKSRAVFALSCLLRRFPLAQSHFIQHGGISVVTKILDVQNPIKIKIKLVTLMNDLLTENIHAFRSPFDENQDISAKQYKFVNLEYLLLEQHWCDYLDRLLFSILATDPENHDILEKCLTSMHTVAKKCNASFSGQILVKLKRKYEALSERDYELNGDNDSNFYSNICKLCDEILYLGKVKTEL